MPIYKNKNLILTTETLRHRERQKQKILRGKGEDGEMEKRQNKIFFHSHFLNFPHFSLLFSSVSPCLCGKFYNFICIKDIVESFNGKGG